jgi:hypothetical protein
MRTLVLVAPLLLVLASPCPYWPSSRRRLARRCNLKSRCRRKRTKALRHATPGSPDLWGNRKTRVLPTIRLDVPIRAAQPVRAPAQAGRALKLDALHANFWHVCRCHPRSPVRTGALPPAAWEGLSFTSRDYRAPITQQI